MSYKEKLNKIKNFVFDVDGVFTDGIIYVDSQGNETRGFNSKDGIVVKKALKCGFNIIIISGAKSKGILKRLRKLGIKDIYLGSEDKSSDLNEHMKINNMKRNETLYMGDDISDLEAMKIVGLKTCPNDAVSEVRNASDYISPKKGGFGCVRDVLEQTLKVQKKWKIRNSDQNI